MQITDKLRVLVEAETARAIENFRKLSGGIEDSEKKTLSLGDALESLSKNSLIASTLLVGAGTAAIKFAGENEKLKLSLKNMTGSAEEAVSVFEEWRQLGSSPGLSVDAVFSLGRAMVNMGHDTEYATSTMQMLGNVAAGTGVSFGEISNSFERARAMGNLTTRDLVRLQQQGIPVVKQLAAELGTTEENVRKLAAEGKIGFADLERAFRSMTGPGGQFFGMMDELSGTVLEKFSSATDDAKQALASFGEMLLPVAADLLDTASSVLNGITNMDEGTKRFVVGMGAMIAVSGPAIMAIKGVGAAMALVMANPYILAIGGVIAAAAAVAGIINKQTNAYQDLNAEIRKTKTEADNLLRSYADGNDAKVLDKQTTESLIRLYPNLVGEITAYSTTVDEAAQAVKRLTEAEITNAAQKQIEVLKRQAAAVEEASEAYERYHAGALRNIEIEERFGDMLRAQDFRDAIRVYENAFERAAGRAEATRRQINSELAKIGKELGEDFSIIDIPVTLSVAPAGSGPSSGMLDARKSWQEWFGEITKIDPELFGSSGARAAQLYIAEFERGFAAQTSIAEVLGEQFDISGVLKSRQSDVQNALVELLAIDPEQINQPFTLASESVRRLVEEYQRLGDEARKAEFNRTIEDLARKIDDLGKSERQLVYEAELARLGLSAQSDAAQELAQTLDRLSVAGTLSGLSREVQNLGKDQYDLTLATMAAAGATEEEIRQANEMIRALREARTTVDELALSFEEFLSQKVANGLLGVFPDLEKQAAKALGNISAQLASISFDSALSGLSTLGEAFAKGENAADSFKQAMAGMAQQILNQLPILFLQAGLQLIAQGQWPLGLGFVAAAGSSAIIGGYVKGTIDNETSAARNAHGNVFDAGGIIPFAQGGSFTNQIVNRPTYFRFGGKFGVMGEAGPESIMPLRRMANGDLGVASSGGGTQVFVNIINNSGEDVRKEEYTDSEGNKQIEVFIGNAFNNHITSGKGDRAMARFGIRPVGV